jgi:hypothetical protein
MGNCKITVWQNQRVSKEKNEYIANSSPHSTIDPVLISAPT